MTDITGYDYERSKTKTDKMLYITPLDIKFVNPNIDFDNGFTILEALIKRELEKEIPYHETMNIVRAYRLLGGKKL